MAPCARSRCRTGLPWRVVPSARRSSRCCGPRSRPTSRRHVAGWARPWWTSASGSSSSPRPWSPAPGAPAAPGGRRGGGLARGLRLPLARTWHQGVLSSPWRSSRRDGCADRRDLAAACWRWSWPSGTLPQWGGGRRIPPRRPPWPPTAERTGGARLAHPDGARCRRGPGDGLDRRARAQRRARAGARARRVRERSGVMAALLPAAARSAARAQARITDSMVGAGQLTDSRA